MIAALYLRKPTPTFTYAFAPNKRLDESAINYKLILSVIIVVNALRLFGFLSKKAPAPIAEAGTNNEAEESFDDESAETILGLAQASQEYADGAGLPDDALNETLSDFVQEIQTHDARDNEETEDAVTEDDARDNEETEDAVTEDDALKMMPLKMMPLKMMPLKMMPLKIQTQKLF